MFETVFRDTSLNIEEVQTLQGFLYNMQEDYFEFISFQAVNRWK